MKTLEDLVSDSVRKNFVRMEEEEQNIMLRYGHRAYGVPGDDAWFFYTMGRCIFGLPEIFLTGPLDHQVGIRLVNALAEDEDEGVVNLRNLASLSTPVELEDFTTPLKLTKVDPKKCEMFQAIYFAEAFRVDIDAVQMIWPDKNDKFPGDEGYALADSLQPIGRAPKGS